MRRICVLLSFLILVWSAGAQPLQLYAAPDGDDAAPGSQDHPFATLQRARDEIRKRKPHGAIVNVRGGVYRLSQPLILTPEDSGNADAPIIYAAAADQTPVLSGGVVIAGWKVDHKGHWQTHLPEVQKGDWNFNQLFVNGQRRFRPRLPKEKYYYIAGEAPPSAAGAPTGFDRFHFNPGEIKSDFTNLGDVETLCFSHWTMSRLKIASVDDAQHIVAFTGTTRTTADYGKLHQGWRYLLENVADALSDRGEWYLDRKTGTLTYIPIPGKDPAKHKVVAPKREQLVILQGDAPAHQWVHHVIFRGLSFEHTNWNVPRDGYSSSQAEQPLPGAIAATGARDCIFDGCTIEHVGTYAIELGAGCQRNRIENCLLSDLGAGGIKVGEPGISADNEAIASRNIIRSNLIIHGGRVHPAAVGILVLQSPDNLVEHNEIADFYYTGISSGWTWGYDRGLATGNQYLHNYVHQIGQGVLSDMGGIYTLGNHAGSVIRGNRFEQIESFSYGGWGIYFDEGTTDILAEHNLVIGTKSGGFHQHYGKNNIVRNNIFAFGREQWLQRSRVEDHLSFTFQRNILIGDQPTVFSGNWKDKVVVDYNLYWNRKGEVKFDGVTLADRQKTGQDVHSLVADPQFTDPPHGDFGLKPGSPAEKIGFKSFDLNQAGLLPPINTLKKPDAPAGYPKP